MRSPKLLATRKRKLLALAVVVTAIGILVAANAISEWINSPSGETIHIQTGTASPSGLPVEQAIRTSYFYTEIPQGWHVREYTDKSVPSRLEMVAFTPSGVSSQIAITIDLLPSNQLVDIADYHYRASNTAEYKSFTDPNFPAGTQGFQKTTTETEYTVFIVHRERYASVSVSGADTSDRLLAILQHALQHWVWQ